MKKMVFSLLVVLFYGHSYGQDETLKVLSYNLLNYPNPEIPADYRADTLKKIIDYYTPDLFLMQELKSSSGFSTILNNVFNTNGVDYYETATWEPQHSNPGSTWKLQQNVIYNTQKLALSYETFLFTVRRDINVFKFYFKDPNLASHQDTTYLYAITLHLKSSQGADNEAQRLAMVEILENFLDTIPPDANVIVGGDYNLYTSDEAAYQLLLNVSNSIVLADPLNSPGTWHNNNNFRFIHTQSTRTVPINDDGAGGGMDDRFDLIMVSENIIDQNNPVSVVEDTYRAIGNNGNCFNARIIDCEDNDVPANVINALFQMSDHLPIKMELEVDYPLFDAINEYGYKYFIEIISQNTEHISISINDYNKAVKYKIVDANGRIIYKGSSKASGSITLQLNNLTTGIYFIVFESELIKPFKFIKS